ncbi:MAG: TetR/AcrR family transcriptional regulator [Anaerolineales bacterium]|nr:TetR/AcrR family transcriptional regulator [Anaerolineales bacterium]MCX7607920.1 TetR/AcrR family transcriptional regulator [Anaerolineales bacterium]MDW8227955.1 TetR/AcrR family transcriptional regulator [Anaerolineales bacterium]
MTQQRSEATRAQLLEAALRCFALVGYNAASVDGICAEAGFSKGAFYHHFPSKQAVFLALLDGWLKTIAKGLESLRQATVPETFVAMTSLLPVILASADERLPMFLEFWLQASRDEKVWEATIAPYRHYQEYFARLVADGVAEGSLKPETDPQAAAQVILSLAVGLFLQGVLDPQGADWQKVGEESMKILMNGLAK